MSFNRFDYLEIGEQEAAAAKAPQPVSPKEEQPVRPLRTFQQGALQPSRVAQTPPSTVDYRLNVAEVIGKRGFAAGEFSFPSGLAIDKYGVLYVADAFNHRVQRITPDGVVSVIGGKGTGRGLFQSPVGVAASSDGIVYVVEQGNHRIQKIEADGSVLPFCGRYGTHPGEFRAPMAIAVSPETNEILVADTGNARVQRFDTNGRVIGALGAAGSLQPPLTSPLAICCNKGGTVFVADSQANRLMRYDPVGRYIGQYGGARINQGRNFAPGLHLNTPQGITANAHSLLYVTMGTVTQGTIIVIDASSGDVVSEMDDPKRGLGFMSRPSGIAITEVGGVPSEDPMERESIYVSDTMNHRVLRFTWHITR